jgi:hypothetical protein
MEENHGKDGKYGKKKTDKWQMTNDKSPMTNFFPGYPGSIASPPRSGVTGRLVRRCEWDSAPPLKFARALLGRAACRPSHPRSPWDEKNVSDAHQENHKPGPAPHSGSSECADVHLAGQDQSSRGAFASNRSQGSDGPLCRCREQLWLFGRHHFLDEQLVVDGTR